jgi:hypothetical protein
MWNPQRLTTLWAFTACYRDSFTFFYSGVGVQLGPLGTASTDWPIVPAPFDYDDGEFGGMKIGRGNRSTRRKPAPAPLYPPQIQGTAGEGITGWKRFIGYCGDL